jgi:hypothetical protein
MQKEMDDIIEAKIEYISKKFSEPLEQIMI